MTTLRRLSTSTLAVLLACGFLLLPTQQATAATPPVTTSAQAVAITAPPGPGGIGGYCSPGQWTQVHWIVHPFWPANYRYTVLDGVRVNWRFFSSEPPFYWEGAFTTQGDIWTPNAWYTTYEFMCSSYSPVWVTPL